MAFRAADAIHHVPSETDHILAADERDGRVVTAGGDAEQVLDAGDCKLARLATDQARVEMITKVASIGDGVRGKWARLDCFREGIAVPPPSQGSLF